MATVNWTEALLDPCSICDVEFGSLTCFERRGYQYLRSEHRWVKDENGKPIISDKRECDYQLDYWKLVYGDKSIEEVMKEEEAGNEYGNEKYTIDG